MGGVNAVRSRAAVIAGGLLLAALTSCGDDGSQSEADVAENFLRGIYGDTAVTIDLEDPGHDAFVEHLDAFLEGSESEIRSLSCGNSGDGGRVACSVESSDAISTAIGSDGYSENWWLTVSEEAVVDATWQIDEQSIDPLVEWVTANRPEVFAAGGACAVWFEDGFDGRGCGAALVEAAVASGLGSG